ncbi:MAG: hypothetical protein ACK4VI_08965 [Alphaproteobacteria bacterium]
MIIKTGWAILIMIKDETVGVFDKRTKIVRRRLKTLIAVIIISTLLFSAFMLWTGSLLFGRDPCRNWRPGMTDEQKILMALENTNRSNALVFEIIRSETGETYADLIPQIPYKSAEVILREQPDCCHIYSQDTAFTDHPKPVNKTLAGDEGVVIMRYVGRYRLHSKAEMQEASAFMYQNLNNCKP